MSQPLNRPRNIRILIDFSSVWKILDTTPISREQKQNLIYHIFALLELDIEVVMAAVRQQASPDDVVSMVHPQVLGVLTMGIYQLMVYHNLFVIEIPDDSNGIVVEFPYGALHVDENSLVLVGSGLPDKNMLAGTPSLFQQLAIQQLPTINY